MPPPRRRPSCEARGARVCTEGIGVVIADPEGVGEDVGDRGRIFPLAEQVRRDPSGAGHRQAPQHDPLVIPESAGAQADVVAAGLPPVTKDELVAVCREVADAIERRCGTVGDHTLLRTALPAWRGRGELEPGGAKLQVISWRCPGEAVDTVRHAVTDRHCLPGE